MVIVTVALFVFTMKNKEDYNWEHFLLFLLECNLFCLAKPSATHSFSWGLLSFSCWFILKTWYIWNAFLAAKGLRTENLYQNVPCLLKYSFPLLIYDWQVLSKSKGMLSWIAPKISTILLLPDTFTKCHNKIRNNPVFAIQNAMRMTFSRKKIQNIFSNFV